jgi:hypothetical protein
MTEMPICTPCGSPWSSGAGTTAHSKPSRHADHVTSGAATTERLVEGVAWADGASRATLSAAMTMVASAARTRPCGGSVRSMLTPMGFEYERLVDPADLRADAGARFGQ